MMQVLLIILTLLVATACGGSSSSSDRVDGATPPVGTLDPVGKIAFSANPVRSEARMLSYAEGAARLSLIDPDTPRELWGVTAPGFDFAVSFPDSQGAALFGETQLRVVSGTDERTFFLAQAYAHTASAAAALAYALSSADGQSVELIRYLGSAGRWQHERLQLPWSTEIAERPEGQPVLLATLFNAEGTALVAFRPADGRYTVFSADSSAAALVATGRDCAGDGVGVPEQATFRSVAWDEGRSAAYAGDRFGRVYAIDPDAACVPLSALASLVLDAAAITQIAVTAPGELSVLQDNGRLHRLTYDGRAFFMTDSFATPCAYPDGTVALGGDIHLVTCLSESASGSGSYDLKEYLTLHTGADTVLATFTLAETQARNIVIDSARRLMFRVEDNALGVLWRYELLSGTVSEQRGLFLEDILAHP